MIPIRAYGLPSWSSAWPSARAIKWVPLRRAAKTNSEEQPKILQFIRRGMLLRNTVTLLFSAAHLRRILANTPSITMRYGLTCFACEGRAIYAYDRALRRHCRVSDPWRTTASLSANLSFRKRHKPQPRRHVKGPRCDREPPRPGTFIPVVLLCVAPGLH